jgi:hypothetical protein
VTEPPEYLSMVERDRWIRALEILGDRHIYAKKVQRVVAHVPDRVPLSLLKTGDDSER